MPKTNQSVSSLAAMALIGLAGVFLWPAADLRRRDAVPPAAGSTKTRGETDRARSPAGPVVAMNPAPSPDGMAPQEIPPEAPAEGSGWARVLRELAATAAGDPHAALVRVAEFAEAEERQAALKEVCAVIALRDPALAFAAAWRFELGKLGGLAETQALENLARTWAARDLDAALAWLTREPQDQASLRDHAVKGIAASFSEDAPASAALLIEAMPDNHPRFEATVALIGEWVDRASPPDAKAQEQAPSRRKDS